MVIYFFEAFLIGRLAYAIEDIITVLIYCEHSILNKCHSPTKLRTELDNLSLTLSAFISVSSKARRKQNAHKLDI